MNTNTAIEVGSNNYAIANRFVAKVYLWMCVALATTAGFSVYVLTSENIMRKIMASPGILTVLILAELGLVIGISAAIGRLSAAAATFMFFLYSALNGITLAPIFLIYTSSSIASTFLICSLTFAAMGFYGLTTKKDLTGVGSLAFMGLIGIIIASVINIFIKSSSIGTIIPYVGVLVFVGLTAYDAQRIKAMAGAFSADSEQEKKGAIIGALSLYLDFINLFLILLRIFGKRR